MIYVFENEQPRVPRLRKLSDYRELCDLIGTADFSPSISIFRGPAEGYNEPYVGETGGNVLSSLWPFVGETMEGEKVLISRDGLRDYFRLSGQELPEGLTGLPN